MIFNDSNVDTGLDRVSNRWIWCLSHGGIGGYHYLLVRIGEVLKVNSGGSALEFELIEAIVNMTTLIDLKVSTLAIRWQDIISRWWY